MTLESNRNALIAAAEEALTLIGTNARIGLGSGRAVNLFIEQLGTRVRAGLRVSVVPAAKDSMEAAIRAGIDLITLEEGAPLDLTIDGADEVAPNLDLIKGWGGALARERIVAAASKRQVILVDSSKLVDALGQRGRIPIEILPFARPTVLGVLREIGLAPAVRTADGNGGPFITENGNLIIDCTPLSPLADSSAAAALKRGLRAIPGVIDTGIFLGTAERAIVGYPDGHVETLLRGSSGA